ncbi:batten's disease protein Cln3 [Obba rivulosa]|uniref:Protein BTN n=1 Tax=Obba rivulosa TaxID=1052685 RepID=A0A8E2DRQ6_9APHY|nr:batten's disease protein Cln3 [Obba rivulosa]
MLDISFNTTRDLEQLERIPMQPINISVRPRGGGDLSAATSGQLGDEDSETTALVSGVDVQPAHSISEGPLAKETAERAHLFYPHPQIQRWSRRLFVKLGLSFFLFGLINNVLYVIILSAALDLVPPSTPKGIIAFCNIFPALLAKLGWPYILKGRIRYAKRLVGCTVISVSGMLVVALFDSLAMRLLGICCASFSSGLGELTFLQLSTRYHPPSVAGHSVGYFASGTGGAGLVGAFLWWELRNLGVRTGVGLSSVLPLVIPITYFLLLPPPAAFLGMGDDADYDDAHVQPPSVPPSPYTPYVPLPADDAESTLQGVGMGANGSEGEMERAEMRKGHVALSAQDKWRLVKPLLMKYMMPLFCVYLFEYTINQGISPTLVYPVPSPSESWLMSKIIHSIRDYYPLWQLVYQTTVFFSRSSISLGIPPLPSRLLFLPALLQGFIMLFLGFESAVGVFGDSSPGASFWMVFLLIALEGTCGGLAYINAYYRVGQEHRPAAGVDADERDAELARQEREFRIGAIGMADSAGILVAALVAVPTEVDLCRAQVARGKMLCKSL